MILRRSLLAALVVLAGAGAARAHEFWLDPEAYTVAPGDAIVAHTRIGQGFEGSSFAYLPQNFRRYEIVQGETVAPVASRMGDRPSFNQPAPGDGLAIIIAVTGDLRLTYNEFEKFRAFVEHKDADWTLTIHAERGFPETGFAEAYSRYAKSLVGVGGAMGADRAFGLETELVALANPYTDDLSGGLPVQVLYQGNPRPEAQVELFERAGDGTVAVTLHKADASGIATLPVQPGHVYMADAVLLREPDDEMKQMMDVVWESLWANLTFAVPAD